MKQWRSKKWKPIKIPFYVLIEPIGHYISAGDANSLFEAGADAMLEVLKKEGQYEKWSLGTPIEANDDGIAGWLVFIPDEEQ